MEKNSSKYNKATLIAAALIITGATAIFGTYANYDELAAKEPISYTSEDSNRLTDRQRMKIEQAHELYEKGEINCI